MENVPHDVIGQAKYIGASTCFKVKSKNLFPVNVKRVSGLAQQKKQF